MSAVGGITCYKVQQKRGVAYRAALTIGHGSKGTRRKTVTRKTKDEALKAIYALRADFDRGVLKSRSGKQGPPGGNLTIPWSRGHRDYEEDLCSECAWT